MSCKTPRPSMERVDYAVIKTNYVLLLLISSMAPCWNEVKTIIQIWLHAYKNAKTPGILQTFLIISVCTFNYAIMSLYNKMRSCDKKACGLTVITDFCQGSVLEKANLQSVFLIRRTKSFSALFWMDNLCGSSFEWETQKLIILRL